MTNQPLLRVVQVTISLLLFSATTVDSFNGAQIGVPKLRTLPRECLSDGLFYRCSPPSPSSQPQASLSGLGALFNKFRASKPLHSSVASLVDEPGAASNTGALQIQNIRNALPADVFERSLWKSVFYMLFDFAAWGGSFLAISTLVKSAAWATMPFALKAAASMLYWNVAGFFMWCIFVVGHDCGHTTFSNNKWLNDILGHVTHGSLLVPFYPWQLSHRRHHMYHNHVDKDYSYMWFPEDKLKKDAVATVLHKKPFNLVRALYPLVAWPLYIAGAADGSHLLPLPLGRLYRGAPRIEKIKCLVSAAVMAAVAGGLYTAFQGSVKSLLFYYFVPHMVFGWWLFAVTYLQHHGKDTLVYDNHDWDYVKGGFETVDRTFGAPIDVLSHHITDGHVVHHMFFTQIPHYNLMRATRALQNYLKENGVFGVYKFEETFDFPVKVHQYMWDFGLKVDRATPLPASAPATVA